MEQSNVVKGLSHPLNLRGALLAQHQAVPSGGAG